MVVTLVHTKDGELKFKEESLQPVLEKVKLDEPEEKILENYQKELDRIRDNNIRRGRLTSEEVEQQYHRNRQIVLNFHRRAKKQGCTIHHAPYYSGGSWFGYVTTKAGRRKCWMCTTTSGKWITY